MISIKHGIVNGKMTIVFWQSWIQWLGDLLDLYVPVGRSLSEFGDILSWVYQMCALNYKIPDPSYFFRQKMHPCGFILKNQNHECLEERMFKIPVLPIVRALNFTVCKKSVSLKICWTSYLALVEESDDNFALDKRKCTIKNLA